MSNEAHMSSLEVVTHKLETTIQLGRQMGRLLRGGDILCLSGDIGAGKTALSSGVVNGWGAQEPASSPTFVFVHEHHRAVDDQRLYHIDCYRLRSEADAASIGLEDILAGDGVVLLEWPEQVELLLPAEHLWIDIDPVDDNSRRFAMQAIGTRYMDLLTALHAQVND